MTTAIHDLLAQTVRAGASDLHLREGEVPRLRLYGRLDPVPGGTPLTRAGLVEMLRGLCTPARWEHFEQTGDLDFVCPMERKARFRVSYQKHHGGLAAVFRVIPVQIPSFDDLGAPDALRSFAEFRSGLVLVSGPTGCGKTTTLASLVDHINSKQRRLILTIEDPVEFVHENKKSTVIQREIGPDAPGFAQALRAALRHDVEVLVVGDMGDPETVLLALTAAEMGMLVLGSMHTNSATKTVYRLVDMFPADKQDQARELVSVSLRAVCGQILVRRADGAGRVPAHEIIITTKAIANIVREGIMNQLVQSMMSGRAAGMQLMDDVLRQMVTEGTITGEDAYLAAIDKAHFPEFGPA